MREMDVLCNNVQFKDNELKTSENEDKKLEIVSNTEELNNGEKADESATEIIQTDFKGFEEYLIHPCVIEYIEKISYAVKLGQHEIEKFAENWIKFKGFDENYNLNSFGTENDLYTKDAMNYLRLLLNENVYTKNDNLSCEQLQSSNE